MRLGKAHGIPVRLHWSAAVLMVVVADVFAVHLLPTGAAGYAAAGYWLAAYGLAGLLLAAVLAHEYAHARAAQHYGIRVRSITLGLLGAVAELDDDPPHPRAAALIALAGPAASLGAGALFFVAALPAQWAGARLVAGALAWLAVANALLAVFNLLPCTPLDGGRVLVAIVWRVRGDRLVGRRIAAGAGIALGIASIIAGLLVATRVDGFSGFWLALAGWYITQRARAEWVYARLVAGLGALPVGRLMSAPPICGYSGQTVSGFLADAAAAYPHWCYPVVDLDGHLAGVVTMRALSRLGARQRQETRLAKVLIPVGRVPVAQRETLIAEPSALPTEPPGLTVVLDSSRPCGVLTAGDLRRALAVAELGEAPDRTLGELTRPGLPR